MRKITKISAKPKPPKRKRTAAYARVSRDGENMLHSLSAQVSYYSSFIQNRPEWEYAGVYADFAETGTKEERPEFRRLIMDCRAGKIDVILVKTISRFARNTVTVLETVRELKTLGVDVYFEEPNIHSVSPDGELMLTVLASFAQAESLSASENRKWRYIRDFKSGRMASDNAPLGYKWVDGKYEIIPEEAEIVRWIFGEYLNGAGYGLLAKKCREKGVEFSDGGICHLLRNVSYTGDLLLQTTCRTDHLTKKHRRNKGELPQYYIENAHEGIISREIFTKVQTEMQNRARKFGGKAEKKTAQTYPYSGLIKCGNCGKSYRRKHANAGSKYEKIVWICTTFNSAGKAACDSQQIPESVIDNFVVEIGLENILEIRVPKRFTLVFVLKNGTEIVREWKHGKNYGGTKNDGKQS
jgi:DNA invertase Pin-like site-specific DNA recombinase